VRSVFHEQLANIELRISDSLEIAVATLQEVARVVSDTSSPTPSSIERDAARLRQARRELSEVIVITMARQTPVAADLRLVLALMEISHHISLVANQFDLVTAQLMEIDPEIRYKLGTGDRLGEMALLAASELQGAADALRERDPRAASRIRRADGDLNRINREVFDVTALGAEDVMSREVALRHVMIARSLERIGDNAVDIAEQVAFLVTGEQSGTAEAQPARET
jgi:phosphate transport system protein